MAPVSPSKTVTASGTKKSFFKRPAWATNAPSVESRDFFRHADTVYDSIVREKERKREKSAQKKIAKNEQDQALEPRESKRRRISTAEENVVDDQRSASEASEKAVTDTEDDFPQAGKHISCLEPTSGEEPPAPPVRSVSPARKGTSAIQEAGVNSNMIEVDSDGAQKALPSPEIVQPTHTKTTEAEVSEDEDEYVLELKRKAREKSRAKECKEKDAAGISHDRPSVRSTSETQTPSPSPAAMVGASQPGLPQPQPAPAPPPPLSLEKETIVQILITTSMPEAQPLLVNRKVSQQMRQVREVWCARQKFDEETSARIVFTWRGKRLYDTSTSTHLLNVLKKERARQMGFLINGDEGDADEIDPSGGRIELEAMTKDMFEQQQLRQAQRRQNSGQDTDQTGEALREENDARPGDNIQEQADSTMLSTAAKEPEYTIVMNAPHLEPLPLKVRPSTAISKMLFAFIKVRQVDPNKNCWLVFDGERLEPGSRVGQTELEDGDVAEVHIR